jgi:hypothetical protein
VRNTGAGFAKEWQEKSSTACGRPDFAKFSTGTEAGRYQSNWALGANKLY